MSNPFQQLLDQFNKQALQPFLASSKKKLDEAIDSTPSSALARQIEDAYAQLKNGNTGSQQLDAAKIVPMVDSLKKQLQNPVVSLIVAQGLKEFAKKDGAQTLKDSLAGSLSGMSFQEQLIAELVIAQLAQAIDGLKTANAPDVAAKLRKLAANLPSEIIAEQIAAVLKSQQAPQPKTPDLSELPAPEALADTTIDVIKAASDALDKASKATTFEGALDALKKFPANANDLITRLQNGERGSKFQPPAVEKEKPVKKAPRRRKGPQGGQFDL